MRDSERLTSGRPSRIILASTASTDMGREKFDCSTRVPVMTTGLSLGADDTGTSAVCARAIRQTAMPEKAVPAASVKVMKERLGVLKVFPISRRACVKIPSSLGLAVRQPTEFMFAPPA